MIFINKASNATQLLLLTMKAFNNGKNENKRFVDWVYANLSLSGCSQGFQKLHFWVNYAAHQTIFCE